MRGNYKLPMPHCKGICERSDFPYPTKNKADYKNGFVRCQACRKNVQCSEIKCPCCGTDFRRRPRHGKLKQKMLAQIKRY